MKNIRNFVRKQIRKRLLMEEFYHGSPYEFDKFDISKVGSGDGLNKFGWGLYFSDNIDAATYYARELSIGKLKNNGLNLYNVQILNLQNFVGWEDEVPQHIYNCVTKKLMLKNLKDDAEELQRETEEYGMWTVRQLYQWLTVVLGSEKNTSLFLYNCELYGVTAEDSIHGGTIYVSFTDENVKIIEHEKIA